jgi:hypothetical protein
LFVGKLGFSGCFWMIVGWEVGDFVSESGCPGLEDFQDVFG